MSLLNKRLWASAFDKIEVNQMVWVNILYSASAYSTKRHGTGNLHVHTTTPKCGHTFPLSKLLSHFLVSGNKVFTLFWLFHSQFSLRKGRPMPKKCPNLADCVLHLSLTCLLEAMSKKLETLENRLVLKWTTGSIRASSNLQCSIHRNPLILFKNLHWNIFTCTAFYWSSIHFYIQHNVILSVIFFMYCQVT